MIFSENTTQLNQTAHKIHTTMNHLETYIKPSGAPAQSGGLAQLPAQSGGVPQLTGRPAPWSWSREDMDFGSRYVLMSSNEGKGFAVPSGGVHFLRG